MATKNTIYGRLMVIFQDATQLDNLISTGLKQSRAQREITTKDSNDEKESRPTIKSRSMDFSAYASNTSTSNFEQLQAAYDAGTINVWKFSSAVNGSKYFSASGYISDLNYKADHDGSLEVEGTIEITGALTFGTV